MDTDGVPDPALIAPPDDPAKTSYGFALRGEAVKDAIQISYRRTRKEDGVVVSDVTGADLTADYHAETGVTLTIRP